MMIEVGLVEHYPGFFADPSEFERVKKKIRDQVAVRFGTSKIIEGPDCPFTPPIVFMLHDSSVGAEFAVYLATRKKRTLNRIADLDGRALENEFRALEQKFVRRKKILRQLGFFRLSTPH